MRARHVSVLFNEPKLLKFGKRIWQSARMRKRFSALQRAEIAEILKPTRRSASSTVSVLFNEPKLLKSNGQVGDEMWIIVSVLFNEPKLLKS